MFNTKNKIVAMVVLSTMLATLTVGGFSLLYIQDRMHDFALDYLSETTKVYGEEMNTIITQVETVTHTLSNSVKGIIDVNRIDESYYYYGLSEKLESIAGAFAKNDFNIMSIYVRFNPLISYSTAGVFYADINNNGLLEQQKPTNLLLYDPSDVEHVGWFYKPLESNRAIWIDPYYNANIDVNMLSYVSPLEVDGKVIGVVGVDINFERFEMIVKEAPSNSISNGTFDYQADSHERIAGFSILKNGWTVIVSLTEDEALANLNTTVSFLILLNIGVVIVMMLIAILIGRQLNRMVLRNSELEQMVSDRTEALTQANSELNDSLHQLKETQKQLIVSEKLAFLGELVSGIAHEINTPLGMGITLNSFIHHKVMDFKNHLNKAKPTKDELDICVNTIEESSTSALENLKKVADIVDTFKQVAVDQFGQEEQTIYLREHIQRMLMSISSKFENTRHKVTINCPSKIQLATYPGVLTQVMINLILNSLEHGFKGMEDGRIFIEVSKMDNQVMISYKDNGHPLTEEDYDNVFDPFFTSARSSGSVGLGLHIIHNLVTHTLKGDVHIEHELSVEKGLHFILILPISIEKATNSH